MAIALTQTAPAATDVIYSVARDGTELGQFTLVNGDEGWSRSHVAPLEPSFEEELRKVADLTANDLNEGKLQVAV